MGLRKQPRKRFRPNARSKPETTIPSAGRSRTDPTGTVTVNSGILGTGLAVYPRRDLNIRKLVKTETVVKAVNETWCVLAQYLHWPSGDIRDADF